MAIEILRYIGALLLVLALIGAAGIAARKWGVPGVTKSVDQKRLAVVETTAVSAGEFLVGAGFGAQIFDREDAAVEVSTDHEDYFVKNKVAIRAEERLALTVTRPESFVHGYFDLSSSPSRNA